MEYVLRVFDRAQFHVCGQLKCDSFGFDCSGWVGQELALVGRVRPTAGDKLAHLAALLGDERFVLIVLVIHMTLDLQFANAFLD